jgi:glucoamylase
VEVGGDGVTTLAAMNRDGSAATTMARAWTSGGWSIPASSTSFGLGVKSAEDPEVRSTLPVLDRKLRYTTRGGPFWHRASFDGYGEKRDGSQWEPVPAGSGLTLGRGWALLTGERGEYVLARGRNAQRYLDTMARSADDTTFLLAEQVWDNRAPADNDATRRPGENTQSATPLVWTHAQFLRLARSIDAGRPVETPRVVACRYDTTLC